MWISNRIVNGIHFSYTSFASWTSSIQGGNVWLTFKGWSWCRKFIVTSEAQCSPVTNISRFQQYSYRVIDNDIPKHRYWYLQGNLKNILQNRKSKHVIDLYELKIFCDALPGVILFVPILCVMSIQIPGRKILSEFLPVKLDRIKVVRFSSYTSTFIPLIQSIKKSPKKSPIKNGTMYRFDTVASWSFWCRFLELYNCS